MDDYDAITRREKKLLIKTFDAYCSYEIVSFLLPLGRPCRGLMLRRALEKICMTKQHKPNSENLQPFGTD